MRSENGQVIHLSDYKPTDFILERTDLTFELHPTETKVTARTLFNRRPGAPLDADLVLDGDDLTVTSVLLDGLEMPPEQFAIADDKLTIRNLPESVTFEITV